MKYTGPTGEYFEVSYITKDNCTELKNRRDDSLALLWFDSDNNQLTIDGKPYTFNTDHILCITQFHKVEVKRVEKLKILQFNRPFYCILDHDSEVGCKGILYYGSANVPNFSVPDSDIDVLQTAWKMLCLEMESKDNLQLEMLQMMLKRILILCTRLYKSHQNYEAIDLGKQEIVRSFNYLVEQHFNKEHGVAFYAAELFKSPKTLSNIFKKIGAKTPLQFIQERVLLEARRMIGYTDKTIAEIGYELGFSDVQSFSRFFKKQEGVSPSIYRENL